MAGSGELSEGLEYLRLKQEARSGARWLWWIAGLSAVNTIALLAGTSWSFFMGLGITQIFNAFGLELGGALLFIAVLLDVLVIAAFVVLGELAQHSKAAFLIGIALYAFDGLLLLAFQDFTSAGSKPLVVFYELGLYVVLVSCAMVANRLSNRSQFDGLGFRVRPAGRQVLIGLAIFAVTISFILAALALAEDRTNVLSFKARTPLVLLYYLIHSFVFVGFGEELLWRGYFFNRAREITGSGVWAVVLSSVLFGLWHYPMAQDILKVIVTSGLGAIYAVARLKIRDCSTMATGLAHGLHDSTILVLSYFL